MSGKIQEFRHLQVIVFNTPCSLPGCVMYTYSEANMTCLVHNYVCHNFIISPGCISYRVSGGAYLGSISYRVSMRAYLGSISYRVSIMAYPGCISYRVSSHSYLKCISYRASVHSYI